MTSAIAGVPLTAGSIAVNLLEPGARFGERSNRVDIRVSKVFRSGGVSIEPIVELFNIFNDSPVLAYNQTYGPQWLNGTLTSAPRMLKLGLRAEF